MVRNVRPPMNDSELFQIGVEFDTPPREWARFQVETTWGCAPAVERVLKSNANSAAPETKPGAAQAVGITQQELAVAERLTITTDQLIAVLQGPLQRAAESAVEAVRAKLEETIKGRVQRDVVTQLNNAVQQLRCMIDEISRTNARQAESLLLQRLEQMMRSSKEEISRQVDARLEKLLGNWEDQQE